MTKKGRIQIPHVSRNWDRDSPNSYQKKQRLTMLMDMRRPILPLPMSRETSFCSVYSMSTETPLTHVKRNLILLCLQYVSRDSPSAYQCQEKPYMYSALPMSTETPLDHVQSRAISLCSAHINRDSTCPCQEKPNSDLAGSTETPLTHVKRNLTLLYPCQQRIPFTLPMSTETLLWSAHFNRGSPYPCQEKQRLTLPCPCQPIT